MLGTAFGCFLTIEKFLTHLEPHEHVKSDLVNGGMFIYCLPATKQCMFLDLIDYKIVVNMDQLSRSFTKFLVVGIITNTQQSDQVTCVIVCLLLSH